MNLIKVLWCRLQQCFVTFPIFLVETSSETGLFKYLSDYVFGVPNFENKKSMRVFFISKCLKFNLDFTNAAKNREKVFCFWDNCIWIDLLKLSLLRIGYFSSVANVFTSRPKIWHVKKRDIFEHKFVASDQRANMVMRVWCRFQQCLGTLNVLLVEAASETGLFRHLHHYHFGVRSFEKTKSMMVIFLFKNWKI